MSFRIEQKIILGFVETHKIYSYLVNNGMQPLHPRRQINSIYFDNRLRSSFLDSQEGIVPRKKIRVRSYDSKASNNLFLEIKTSSYEGRFKTSTPIDEIEYLKHKKNGIIDRLYGQCTPILNVRYLRDYYSYKGIRITIDKEIEYHNFELSPVFRDTSCVLEFKAAAGTSVDFLDGLVSTPLSRFSKYSRGYEMCGLATQP